MRCNTQVKILEIQMTVKWQGIKIPSMEPAELKTVENCPGWGAVRAHLVIAGYSKRLSDKRRTPERQPGITTSK